MAVPTWVAQPDVLYGVLFDSINDVVGEFVIMKELYGGSERKQIKYSMIYYTIFIYIIILL